MGLLGSLSFPWQMGTMCDRTPSARLPGGPGRMRSRLGGVSGREGVGAPTPRAPSPQALSPHTPCERQKGMQRPGEGPGGAPERERRAGQALSLRTYGIVIAGGSGPAAQTGSPVGSQGPSQASVLHLQSPLISQNAEFKKVADRMWLPTAAAPRGGRSGRAAAPPARTRCSGQETNLFCFVSVLRTRRPSRPAAKAPAAAKNPSAARAGRGWGRMGGGR